MTVLPAAAVALRTGFADALPEMCVSWSAEQAPDPRLLVLNEPLAAELGLDPGLLAGVDGLGLLTGNVVPIGAAPVAQAYAGHQFGGFSPRLGDGRALLLGEILDSDGRLRDLHLKGSGRTPFSRGGDGRAVVGPMLREYVISEAMHALGVPTTRSLAVVATGRQVRREILLPGAVLSRVASSHLRVGSFQFARATGDAALLRRLADFAITRHHQQVAGAADPYLALFDAVVAVQAELISRWMLVGFVHGVMNTDNMTISGETIDYGPCAFLDGHDAAATFSSIDSQGRYAYGNQPGIAEWNLARLAEAMLPLFDDDRDHAVELAVDVLGRFRDRYSLAWSAGMRRKIGLPAGAPAELVDELVADLSVLMQQHRVDHTGFFRSLIDAARGDVGPARALWPDAGSADGWLQRWRAQDPDPVQLAAVNPVYIPRNHLVEEALDAATDGDLAPLGGLLDAVTHPFDERPDRHRYAAAAPPGFGDYQTFCGT